MKNFPSILNIELTDKCNKKCWMCGRTELEKQGKDLSKIYNHEIDFNLLKKISKQLPDNMLIQFHNNGEPLLYSRFGDALELFDRQIKCLNTNGILLMDKYEEIINNLDTITISTFENDNDWGLQYKILCEFLNIKKEKL